MSHTRKLAAVAIGAALLPAAPAYATDQVTVTARWCLPAAPTTPEGTIMTARIEVADAQNCRDAAERDASSAWARVGELEDELDELRRELDAAKQVAA